MRRGGGYTYVPYDRVHDPEAREPFQRLASCIHGNNTEGSSIPLAIMQLNHTGRQASTLVGGRMPGSPPMAPSATRVGSDSKDGVVARCVYRLLFQQAKEMTSDDIDDVVRAFVRGAQLAIQSDFDGIQLHASHGCECILLNVLCLTEITVKIF